MGLAQLGCGSPRVSCRINPMRSREAAIKSKCPDRAAVGSGSAAPRPERVWCLAAPPGITATNFGTCAILIVKCLHLSAILGRQPKYALLR